MIVVNIMSYTGGDNTARAASVYTKLNALGCNVELYIFPRTSLPYRPDVNEILSAYACQYHDLCKIKERTSCDVVITNGYLPSAISCPSYPAIIYSFADWIKETFNETTIYYDGKEDYTICAEILDLIPNDRNDQYIPDEMIPFAEVEDDSKEALMEGYD